MTPPLQNKTKPKCLLKKKKKQTTLNHQYDGISF